MLPCACITTVRKEKNRNCSFSSEMFHLPIRTEWVENQVVITASEVPELKRGDILISVNGLDARQVLVEGEKQISGSPWLRRHRALNILGSSYYQANSLLVAEREGKKYRSEIKMKGEIKNMFMNPLLEMDCEHYRIKELEPGIFYVNLYHLDTEIFELHLQELSSAKAVIYDYRWGGSEGIYSLVPHLVDTIVDSPWWHIPNVIYPNREQMKFTRFNWQLRPEEPVFHSKSLFITSACVVSSGETMIGLLRHANRIITVGGTTAGCNGNTNYIILPNGYRIMFTGMKVLKQDGSQHHLVGYPPDYPVERTLQGVRDGRDEVLEKALEVAREISL